MLKRTLLSAVLVLSLTGCFYPGHAKVARYALEPVAGPKAVVVIGERNEWTTLLEDAIRERGIKVKRFASTERVMDMSEAERVTMFNEASVPIGIELDWSLNPGRRCFGGGQFFDNIRLEAVDFSKNEVVMSATASGYSEGCPPMSGTIFGDFADAVASLWR